MNLYLARVRSTGGGSSVPLVIPADDPKVAQRHLHTIAWMTGMEPTGLMEMVGRTDELVGEGAEPYRMTSQRQEAEREQRQLELIESAAAAAEILAEIDRCRHQVEFGSTFAIVLTQAEFEALKGKLSLDYTHALCVAPTEKAARRVAVQLSDELYSVCCPSMKSA